MSEPVLDQAVAGLLELRDTLGVPGYDAMAHGSGFDRVSAFQDGYEDGPTTCVAYEDEPPTVVACDAGPFGAEVESSPSLMAESDTSAILSPVVQVVENEEKG